MHVVIVEQHTINANITIKQHKWAFHGQGKLRAKSRIVP